MDNGRSGNVLSGQMQDDSFLFWRKATYPPAIAQNDMTSPVKEEGDIPSRDTMRTVPCNRNGMFEPYGRIPLRHRERTHAPMLPEAYNY